MIDPDPAARVALLEEALTASEGDPETRRLLAMALIDAGRAQEAVEQSALALAERPLDGEAWLTRALALTAAGDVEGVRRFLDEATVLAQQAPVDEAVVARIAAVIGLGLAGARGGGTADHAAT